MAKWTKETIIEGINVGESYNVTNNNGEVITLTSDEEYEAWKQETESSITNTEEDNEVTDTRATIDDIELYIRQNDIINNELFKDEMGQAWAYYRYRRKNNLHKIEGEEFEDYIRTKIKQITGRTREAWVQPLIKLFASNARLEKTKKLHLRRADTNNTWHYQISKEKALKIKNGTIEEIDCPPMFKQHKLQQNINVDLTSTKEDFNLIDKYIAIKNKNEKEHFKIDIITKNIPNITRPISLMRGPPGSGKTMHCRIIKWLIDPTGNMNNGIPLRKRTKNSDEYNRNGQQQV